MAEDAPERTPIDGKQARRMRAAAPQMYEALLHLMHHPAECTPAAHEKARAALEAAGMDYERDVEAVRSDRLHRHVDLMERANDHYAHARRARGETAEKEEEKDKEI